MSYKLPESYASCELLPFNRTALETDFELQTPSQDPGVSGYWLLLQGTRLLLLNDSAELPHDRFPAELGDPQQGIYIGCWKNEPCRLLGISLKTELPPQVRSINILDKEPGLSLSLLSLAGLGNAVLHWEKTSRFCDNCAGSMVRISGEWGKGCSACEALHYPRIHPCIIVLVRRDNQLLLVRQPSWPAGRYSLVAGFVEFGENLEQTVARELYEETGIRVTNIRYQGSQSWPFPSQLMTGFTADYSSGELNIQKEELEAGDWFTIDNLPELPPKRSIARWLIDMAVAPAGKPVE